MIEELAGRLVSWIEMFDPYRFRIHPLLSRNRQDVEEKCNRSCPGAVGDQIDRPLALKMWEFCHIRLLHGESLLGDFWSATQTAYFDRSTEDWSVFDILQKWMTILVDYFPPGSYMSLLIMTCPFVRPFFPDADAEIDKIVKACVAESSGDPQEKEALATELRKSIERCNFMPSSDARLQKKLRRFAEMRRVPWPDSPFYDKARGEEPAPKRE